MWEVKKCSKNDEYYPKALLGFSNAPECLYYVGDISICNNLVIAVVGRRDASERYLAIANSIGRLLAKEKITVLNGLALGIDSLALTGALEEKGKTVAVMPCGLDVIYPKSNEKMAYEIVSKGGCLISEYPNGTKPTKYSFVQRDRIQAMISNKVFIVDSCKDSGTMHTANYAIRYSKPVGCFVENNNDLTPEGNRILIDSAKAVAVKGTDELIDFVRQPEYVQMSLMLQ